MAVLTRTVSIPTIGFEVLTQRNEIPQGKYIFSLRQTSTTRQQPFELTYIDYDRANDEISRMERVYYNNAVISNIIGEDYLKDFSIEQFKLYIRFCN